MLPKTAPIGGTTVAVRNGRRLHPVPEFVGVVSHSRRGSAGILSDLMAPVGMVGPNGSFPVIHTIVPSRMRIIGENNARRLMRSRLREDITSE